MRSGEKRRNLPVVLSNPNSSLESVWPIAYLPESIAFEIDLEFAEAEAQAEHQDNIGRPTFNDVLQMIMRV